MVASYTEDPKYKQTKDQIVSSGIKAAVFAGAATALAFGGYAMIQFVGGVWGIAGSIPLFGAAAVSFIAGIKSGIDQRTGYTEIVARQTTEQLRAQEHQMQRERAQEQGVETPGPAHAQSPSPLTDAATSQAVQRSASVGK